MPGRMYGLVNDAGIVIVDPTSLYTYAGNIDGNPVLSNDLENWELFAYDGTRTPYEYIDQNPYYIEESDFCIKNTDIRLPTDEYYLDFFNGDTILVTYRHKGTWQLYDYSFNPISPEKHGRTGYFTYNGTNIDYLLIADIQTEHWAEATPWRIYGLDGELLLDATYNIIQPFGDKLMVCGKDVAGLVDKDNNFIIRAPITAYNAD